MQESRVCDPKLHQLKDSSYQLLLPGQEVLFKALQLQSNGIYRESGEQQQLKVVGLLGSGASCEAHEVQLLPASSSERDSIAGAVPAPAATPSSDNTSAAGNTSGDSSGMGRTHMVLKVPLCWDAVSEKPQYAALFKSDIRFSYRCVIQMEAEYQLLMKLAGTPGIIRCHGYGVAQFTMPVSGCVVPARGLLLELAELGSLAQQLTTETGGWAAMGAAEAWKVIRDMTQSLDKVHKAGCVYEDLKPANICASKASGSLAYQLIDFSSSVPLQPSGMTAPQVVGGTTGFMAPEVEKKLPHTINADTWSLGESVCILSMLICSCCNPSLCSR
jgi:serine/threonine protein kinase